MIISTHTITEEYCEGTLVIALLETDRGGTTFSTVSAVEEIIKIKGPITKSQAPRKRDSNRKTSITGNRRYSCACDAIAIVVIMVEFCGGLWLRPLSQDLFSARERV